MSTPWFDNDSEFFCASGGRPRGGAPGARGLSLEPSGRPRFFGGGGRPCMPIIKI